MSFDEFMEACLYDDEDGFFSKGRVRAGVEGDFLTSPEVSPWFGRLIGRWVNNLDLPDDTALVEIGSGSGSLLGPLLGEAGHARRQTYAVEVSALATASLEERLPRTEIVTNLDSLDADRAVIVMNEVFDNMPAKLVERRSSGWHEVCVGEQGGGLTRVVVPAPAAVVEWCDHYLRVAPTGVVLAAQLSMVEWLQAVFERFSTVHLCIIDYAAGTDELARRRPEDVVRTFHRQRTGLDMFEAPGSTDITVDVNVDVVRRAVEDAGGSVSMMTQDEFLRSLGAASELDAIRERSFERARAGDVMGQLEAKSEATNLGALLGSDGFGSFTVFLVSSGT